MIDRKRSFSPSSSIRKHDDKPTKRLIDNDSDVNTQNRCCNTALHAAASSGHLDIVQILIDNGADVTAKDSNGKTALHLASREGHPEIVQLLIDSDADVNA